MKEREWDIEEIERCSCGVNQTESWEHMGGLCGLGRKKIMARCGGTSFGRGREG